MADGLETEEDAKQKDLESHLRHPTTNESVFRIIFCYLFITLEDWLFLASKLIEKKMKIMTQRTTIEAIFATIATISAFVFAALVVPSPWFWVGWEVLAALLVAIGCIGEWWGLKYPPVESDESDRHRHHNRELRYVLAVTAGVVMELIGLANAIPEAIRLNKDVASLNQTNLMLRSNVVALESEVQWRKISPEAKKAISLALKASPKGPVMVQSDWTDAEAKFFANDIRSILFDAGFEMPPGTIQVFSLLATNGMLMFCTDTNHLPPDASPIQNAFKDAGFSIPFLVNSDLPAQARTEKGPIDAKTLIIWISHKP